MAVRIRLARIGKKKAPFYRIVVIDGRSKRDGEFLENLGTYNPLTGELVQFRSDKIQEWIGKGAIPSDTVAKLQKQHTRATKTSPAKPAAKVVAAPVVAEIKTAATAKNS